jgi:hypothetical protein
MSNLNEIAQGIPGPIARRIVYEEIYACLMPVSHAECVGGVAAGIHQYDMSRQERSPYQ